MAAGTPKPMPESPLDMKNVPGSYDRQYWPMTNLCEPTSQVAIPSRGKIDRSSSMRRNGESPERASRLGSVVRGSGVLPAAGRGPGSQPGRRKGKVDLDFRTNVRPGGGGSSQSRSRRLGARREGSCRGRGYNPGPRYQGSRPVRAG